MGDLIRCDLRSEDGRCTHPRCEVVGLKVSNRRCTACELRKPAIGGAGDLVHMAAKAIGVNPCDDCNRRREALNRAIPFK